ncbi:sulfotransferase family protein [Sphingobium sp. TCM1]|uniref:sulfotransferase family protein n=1 Tax=Sphingobium sp. TCM1 TaxID=453246 RepID=UPI0007F49A7B|nr:sulfotransferase [Sphingobium sp. TCM1]OAN56219.1 hypothetical protein A7Q26_02075 [Sphingobium sp. TCM1]
MLNKDILLAEAEQATGLSDWGDDQSWRTGLSILIEATEAMAPPDVLRNDVHHRIVHHLTTRLRLVKDARDHPEITAQVIERPLVVCGLPRTGTTIIYDLLTRDPLARAPREWEWFIPWPAPEAATFDSDPRIAAVTAMQENWLAHAPELRTIQRFDCTQPGECNHGMSHHFAGTNFWAELGVPKHAQWVIDHIPDGLYRTHKRLLQQFQWKGPRGRWMLKSPNHLFDLQGLLGEYPDAGLIWTHRDPVSTFSSLASMVFGFQKAVGSTQTKQAIGRQVLELWIEAVGRATRVRAARPDVEARIIDLAHADVVHDPIGSVRRIYDKFAIAFTPAHEAQIADFLATSPSRLGKHVHSPEEFGIDPAEVQDRLAAYYARFGHLLARP